jgi:putative acetyltransferase
VSVSNHDPASCWRVAPRRAQEEAELVELWVAAWRATYADIDFEARREWLVAHLAALEARGAQTFCARRDALGVLAGFVVIEPATGWLDQLCVHPRRFGAGAASALIAAARNAAPTGIRLDVNADNYRALRFYARQGFVRIGDGRPSLSGRETLILEWRPRASAG